MKRLFLSLFFILIINTCSFAAEITFYEDFSGYSTIADMQARGWTMDVYNHRAAQPYFDYSISQNSFAITEMYYGNQNFGYDSSRILTQFNYQLPALIDGDFSLSMNLSWLSSSNARKQETWLMFLGPNGEHLLGAQYNDSSSSSQGMIYSRYYNIGSTPATYTVNATNPGTATGDGSAIMTMTRENGILTVRTQLTEANGVPVGGPVAQVSTNTYTDVDFRTICIFFDAYQGASMGDLFIHNISFTGESSTYQPPIPEPATVILLLFACLTNFIIKIYRK